jgi:hypothetical protein
VVPVPVRTGVGVTAAGNLGVSDDAAVGWICRVGRDARRVLFRDTVLVTEPASQFGRRLVLRLLVRSADAATVFDADRVLVIAPVARVPCDVDVADALILVAAFGDDVMCADVRVGVLEPVRCAACRALNGVNDDPIDQSRTTVCARVVARVGRFPIDRRLGRCGSAKGDRTEACCTCRTDRLEEITS